jgi:hypothetical protein
MLGITDPDARVGGAETVTLVFHRVTFHQCWRNLNECFMESKKDRRMQTKTATLTQMRFVQSVVPLSFSIVPNITAECFLILWARHGPSIHVQV